MYYCVYTEVGICHAFMLPGCWHDHDGTVPYLYIQHFLININADNENIICG